MANYSTRNEAKTLPGECYEIARDLAYRLERAGHGSSRELGPLVEGWVRVHVGRIIDEREEAITDAMEVSRPWQWRVARFLRRLADLVRDA